MSNIKIVFFDIDGTLIKPNTMDMSIKTRETLQKLREKGIKICVATGRSPMGLPKFEGIEFDAYLTYNGSCCYTENTNIFCNSLEKEDVKQILDNAEKMNKSVIVAIKSDLLTNGTDDILEPFMEVENMHMRVSENFEDWKEDEVFQVMLACCPDEYDAVTENVKHAKIVTWWPKVINMIPMSGGKGIGIEHVLEYYGFDKSEAMAFGDGNNDIEMLQAVGTGVAMGNAADELKAMADVICGDVTEDGIFHYCVEQGMI